VRFEEYRRQDGIALASALRSGQASRREIFDTAFRALEELNPRHGAVTVRIDPDVAAPADGFFAGIPFLVKDVLASQCAGSPCTLSSRLLERNIAKHDSDIVRRYRAAGLTILGRTNLPNFGAGVCTSPAFRGPARNPWNTSRSAGGSSGGSAVAVALGLVPFAHATDAAGSLRIPASHCGLVGLKPTRGRVPAGPDLGELAAGMGTAHVITRSVRDSAAALAAACGPSIGDPYEIALPAEPFPLLAERAPLPLRIGLVLHSFTGTPVDPEVRAALKKTVAILEGMGHRIEETTLAFDFEPMGEAFVLCHGSNQASMMKRLVGGLGVRKPAPEEIEPAALAWAMQGHSATAADYADGIKTLHRVGRQIAQWSGRFDLLLLPTVANAAPPLGEYGMMEPDFAVYKRKLFSQVQFTLPFNISGQPAITLPLACSSGGLPIGSQLVGKFGEEGLLLALARQLEAAEVFTRLAPVES
jgi:amidase